MKIKVDINKTTPITLEKWLEAPNRTLEVRKLDVDSYDAVVYTCMPMVPDCTQRISATGPTARDALRALVQMLNVQRAGNTTLPQIIVGDVEIEE